MYQTPKEITDKNLNRHKMSAESNAFMGIWSTHVSKYPYCYLNRYVRCNRDA